MQKTNTVISQILLRVRSVSLESWKTVFEVVGVILLALTFLVGWGAWYVTRRINEQQAERLRTFDEQLTDAKTDLANVEIKRLELEKSIKPRELTLVLSGKSSNIEALKEFSGTEVILEFIPDIEAARAAASVKFILEHAGWKLVSIKRSEALEDGVTVEEYLALAEPAPNTPEFADEERSKNAANAIIAFLKSADWEAAPRSMLKRGEIPRNSVRICVGFKPSPYFRPEWVRKMEKEMDEKIRQANKRIGTR